MHLQLHMQGYDIPCEHVRKLLKELGPAGTEIRLANKLQLPRAEIIYGTLMDMTRSHPLVWVSMVVLMDFQERYCGVRWVIQTETLRLLQDTS